MSFLDPGSERVVRSAIEEWMGGALRPEIDGELLLATDNSRYRFIDGVCFSASDEDFVGGELVGWLLESERCRAVSAWWRRGARAVLVLRKHMNEIVVTSATRSLTVDGNPARDGFATQQARFVVDRHHDTVLEPFEEAAAIDVEFDADATDPRPMRASSPLDSIPPKSGLMRLPTSPLPVSPEVERILGPRTLPMVSLPPPRILKSG